MSLQVWLPLNGNLNNQGLSDVTVTNNGAIIDSNGKIGKCYSFNGSSYIKISLPNVFTTIKNTSITAWVYSKSSVLALGGISYDGDNRDKAGCTLYTSGWQFINNSAYKYINAGTIANTSTWKHVAVTVADDTITTYLNGTVVTTGSLTSLGALTTLSSDNFIEIGCDHPGGNEYLTGYVNDFRVYNHCLSAKEVKEISKGLLCHYKLADPYIESTTNYSSQLTGSGGWNNSGSSVRSNDDTSVNRVSSDCPVLSIQQTAAGNSAMTFGNVSTSTYTALKGATVTASVYAYISDVNCSSNVIYLRSTVNDNKTGNNICDFQYNGSTNPQNWPKNQWIRIEGTGTIVSNETAVYFCTYTNNLNEKRYFTCWQLELKDHSTPFVVGSRNLNIEYDVSGYGYNGTISESLPYISSSPRYSGCYYFNSASKRITLPSINMSGFSNSFSISWWGKAPSYSSLMYWGFSNGNRLNYYAGLYCNTGDGSGNPYYKPNTTTTISTPSVNTWHHFVMVGDGSSNKLYMDGELYGVAKTYVGITGNTIVINGWDSSTSYKTNGYISDFRIYSTALPASDIKELYNTSASVDKNGNMYAYEFKEE